MTLFTTKKSNHVLFTLGDLPQWLQRYEVFAIFTLKYNGFFSKVITNNKNYHIKKTNLITIFFFHFSFTSSLVQLIWSFEKEKSFGFPSNKSHSSFNTWNYYSRCHCISTTELLWFLSSSWKDNIFQRRTLS